MSFRILINCSVQPIKYQENKSSGRAPKFGRLEQETS